MVNGDRYQHHRHTGVQRADDRAQSGVADHQIRPRDDQGLGDERLEHDVLARVTDAVEVDAGPGREDDARGHAGERREHRLAQSVLLIVDGAERRVDELV